jgi:hypothetical protein
MIFVGDGAWVREASLFPEISGENNFSESLATRLIRINQFMKCAQSALSKNLRSTVFVFAASAAKF